MRLSLLIPVIQFGYDIIMDDDEDSDCINKMEKVRNFAEMTVPQFNNNQFKQQFRLKPEIFIDLLKKITNVPDIAPRRGHPEIPVDKQLMITLWYIGNMESFRSVANRFGVSKSTCWHIVVRTSFKILNVNQTYKIISWPNRETALKYIDEFKNVNGFPGVVGAIDGSHIRILSPKEFPNSYCNRKNYHSVLLQGVANKKKLFLDVYTGEPGSIHDYNLFTKSDLYERMNRNEILFPNNSHLIGDLAYKLSTTLLVGFKDNGILTNAQKNFNIKLSEIRVVIEHAFALLKGRFRRLKFMETVRLDLISLLIITACILHNMCIMNGDTHEDILDFNIELREHVNNNVQEEAANVANRREAEMKRNMIVNNLQQPPLNR